MFRSAWQLIPVPFRISILMDACPGTVGHLSAAQIRRADEEARAAVARQWLPVIDSLDLALTHATADPATIVDGVEAVREQALGVLARLGFPRRDDRGARFDPTRHEAVATRPDPDPGTEADMVAEVVRPGYGEGDHQLRPAQVVVARPG
jgi:molecular chaperone GrpE